MRTKTLIECPVQAKYCVMHYADLTEAQYLAHYYESAFNYARSYGSDELVLSDTFWKWWKCQFINNDLAMANTIENNEMYNANNSYLIKQDWLMLQAFTASEVYPADVIRTKIKNELLAQVK